MTFQLLTRLPPTISIGILYSLMISGGVLYYLVGTVWGVFGLSLAFWWLAPFLFGVEPFTASQLIDFMSVMPSDYKVATVSAVITIVGFLVAFHLATLNWKQQMRAQLKSAAASEIEEFFSEVSSLVTDGRLFAESVVEAIEVIQTQPTTDQTEFKVRYVLDQSEQFLAIRRRLADQSIEVHRLIGKHYLLLSTGWGSIGALEKVAEALSEITSTMWFHVPTVRSDDQNLIGRFQSYVRTEDYWRFIKCCNKHYDYINAMTGGIRGHLLSQVVGFNLFSVLHMLSARRELKEAMDMIYSKTRKQEKGKSQG